MCAAKDTMPEQSTDIVTVNSKQEKSFSLGQDEVKTTLLQAVHPLIDQMAWMEPQVWSEFPSASNQENLKQMEHNDMDKTWKNMKTIKAN